MSGGGGGGGGLGIGIVYFKYYICFFPLKLTEIVCYVIIYSAVILKFTSLSKCQQRKQIG